jgi:gluconolactonase
MLHAGDARSLTAEVFTTMPEALHVRDRTNAWVAFQRQGHPTPSILEGPAFDRDGNLWLVDVPWGRLLRVDPDGDWDVALEYEGEPNGLKIDADGTLVVADFRNGILWMDPRDGTILRQVDRAGIQGLQGPNDLCWGPDGAVYFTDQGVTDLRDPSGHVYSIAPDGKVRDVAGNLPSPNGIVFSPDGSRLHVAVTKANAVWRGMVIDGELRRLGVFLQFSGGSGPDGLAVTVDGGLVVAHAGFGRVWHVDAKGAVRTVIDSPRRRPGHQRGVPSH